MLLLVMWLMMDIKCVTGNEPIWVTPSLTLRALSQLRDSGENLKTFLGAISGTGRRFAKSLWLSIRFGFS